MAIDFIIADKVTFKVDGSEKTEEGTDKPFDFSLTCARLDMDQLQAKQQGDSDQSFADFMVEVTEAWSGPREKGGAPVPYTADNFRTLLKRPGLAPLCFRRYMLAVAVQGKEKNSR
jgi:hypothetical protein